MTYLAIMEHGEGRIKRVEYFKTEAEAQAHVDKFKDKYLDPFVAEHPGDLRYYVLDSETKTFTLSPDPEELNKRVKEAILGEAFKRLDSFSENSIFETGASLYLCLKRAHGDTWSAGEANVASQMLTHFTYFKDVYLVAKQAISNIPNMTEQEKLNFNAATDITWPTVQ